MDWEVDKKIRIVFDTSFVRNAKAEEFDIPLSTETINQILKFIKTYGLEKNIDIIIADLVLEEIIFQKLEGLNLDKENLTRIHEKHKKYFGIDSINLEKFQKFDYYKYLKEKCDKFIKTLNFESIPYPRIEVKMIIERALYRQPPFEKNSDKGLKDTILWCSILEDAKKYQDAEYILCAGDQIFRATSLEKEFLAINKNGIHILKDSIEVQECLSEIFKEDTKYKERTEEVKRQVELKMGDILIDLHKSAEFEIFSLDEIQKVVSLSFRNVNILSIAEIEGGYEIILDLDLEANYLYAPSYKSPYQEILEREGVSIPSVMNQLSTKISSTATPFGIPSSIFSRTNINSVFVKIRVSIKLAKDFKIFKIIRIEPESPLRLKILKKF